MREEGWKQRRRVRVGVGGSSVGFVKQSTVSDRSKFAIVSTPEHSATALIVGHNNNKRHLSNMCNNNKKETRSLANEFEVSVYTLLMHPVHHRML